MNTDGSNGHDVDENGACRVSVMFVDDDPAFLEILEVLLQTYHRDQLTVVGTAHSGAECVIKAQTLLPQVVLMDLNMPGRGGLWAIPLLQILFPETRVIALTRDDSRKSRNSVIESGASDLVSKIHWKTDLIPAIQRAVKMSDLDHSFASD
jgi:DNA-binding NarL/FixJ family response regulator